MTAKQIEDMRELDVLAEEAGGYVAPIVDKDAHYDYRKLIKYCKEKNIDPQDLTLRELQMFLVQ